MTPSRTDMPAKAGSCSSMSARPAIGASAGGSELWRKLSAWSSQAPGTTIHSGPMAPAATAEPPDALIDGEEPAADDSATGPLAFEARSPSEDHGLTPGS